MRSTEMTHRWSFAGDSDLLSTFRADGSPPHLHVMQLGATAFARRRVCATRRTDVQSSGGQEEVGWDTELLSQAEHLRL